MQQRELFSNATAFTKDFLSDGLLNSVYATLRGATKSLFLNINQAIIYSLRVLEGDLTNLNKIATPIMQKVINENDFSVEFALDATSKGVVPLIDGLPPTGAKIYFGSISELNGDNLVCKGLGTGNNDLIGAKRELKLTKDEAPSEGARQYGFQNTADECGAWPFVYSVEMPTEAGQELNILLFDENIVGIDSLINIHLFFFDNKQNAIGYANVVNPEALAPTP
jgi:hypothetical protein